MPSLKPLSASRLHATLDPATIDWEDSGQIPLGKPGKNPFQARAMHALDLALRIGKPGYNIYLSGEADLGRGHMLLSWLRPRAAKLPAAADLLYVRDFSDPDAPLLLSLPAGQGRKMQKLQEELISSLGPSLEKILDTLPIRQQRACLLEQFNTRRTAILAKMNQLANERGFNLEIDDGGGITLTPLDGKKRKDKTKPKAKWTVDEQAIARNLLELLRQLNSMEENYHQEEEKLEKQAMTDALAKLFPDFEKAITAGAKSAEIDNYLHALKKDLLEHSSIFLPSRFQSRNEEHASERSFLSRYGVNIFVDNSQTHGAPIISEDNPSIANLMGCMERESELGALVTDFSLIRAGSLQKANGGFLILHVEDLLQHPPAWDALLRALRSGRAKIEDGLEQGDSATRTKSLSPQPLELDVKVILIGGEDMYEDLLFHDDRFSKLFGIKAHMADEVARNSVNIRHYLTQIARIIKEDDLPCFNRGALAWLVDLGSHLCEDQKRLSLKFPLIRKLMIEASALAKARRSEIVDSAILEEAYADRNFRGNLVEEIFMEDYDRQMIKLETSGSAIGQVNGLAVTMHGDFEFGLPHRIACAVGVGHDGIIDLERESELGGPIHTKAMLILKSYLTRLFARKKPLVLNASLYFEQSYAGIEGDSASGAELVALLSALADVPVRLDLAFTGAVSHTGQIMAVGGVTRKVEGFYKVCARKGLTGSQGVIIPKDNVDHLMCAPEILESVKKNRFSIFAITSIEEALTLLTGMPVGKARKNGGFTSGSLFDLVDRRLEQFGYHAQNAFRKQRKE